MLQEEEQILIEQAKKGNDEAFTILFRNHYQFLYHYLIKLTLQVEETEDLLQDTMIKAYTYLTQFKGNAKFSTWLISIATRLFLDGQRKKRRDKNQWEHLKAEAIRKAKWHTNKNGLEWTHYLDIFTKMDSSISTPILLHYYYGFTYKEISKIMSVKEGTVKTRVHYGIKKLRKEFKQE